MIEKPNCRAICISLDFACVRTSNSRRSKWFRVQNVGNPERRKKITRRQSCCSLIIASPAWAWQQAQVALAWGNERTDCWLVPSTHTTVPNVVRTVTDRVGKSSHCSITYALRCLTSSRAARLRPCLVGVQCCCLLLVSFSIGLFPYDGVLTAIRTNANLELNKV